MGESVWHQGHILGGYQNEACPACLREQRRFSEAQAIEREDDPLDAPKASEAFRDRAAIEAEARADLLDRLAAGVRDLDWISEAAVLALLEASRE